jgi:hypothetical protein
MPDPYTNARPYFDVAFPSSGDSFSIQGFRNAFAGLGFLDMIPLQPRAHNPPNLSIMVRGQDASQYYNPVYFGNADQRIPFSSGDTSNFSAPAANPRIDIVFLTPSGDVRVQTGTEAINPTLPSLGPSGDTRFPVAAIWCKPGMTKIVNFEDKDSNSGDGYIYKDLRPWMRSASAGQTTLSSATMSPVTGDNTAGTSTQGARADHHHQGVRTIHVVGSGDLFGDVQVAGPAGAIVQSGNRITFLATVIGSAFFETGAVATGSTALPYDDTPPRNDEGDQFMTKSYTPKNANSLLKITVVCNLTCATAGQDIIAALFQDAIVNALGAVEFRQIAANGTALVFVHWMLAGTIQAITFNVRGGAPSGTITFNGDAGARIFGGVMASSLTIEEYAQ